MMKTIPFMRLDRQFRELEPDLMPALATVLASGRVLQSPEVERLEARLAALHELPHAVAVNSGTDALAFALMSLALAPGSRVAVTALSFVASASAIVHAGLEPVFVDVDPETLLADGARLAELVDRREVAAVVAVHLYGQLSDLAALAALARERNVALVEDAAQAIGALRDGRPAGSHGVATCLSFDPTKVIGAFGSGGAVLTADAELARAVRLLRYHGHAGNRIYSRIGYNSQMDTVQAVILDRKMDRLPAWQEKRTAVARRLDAALPPEGPVRRVRTLEGNTHNVHKYVVRTDRRDELKAHLLARGVETAVHYTMPLHRQPAFAGLVPETSLPVVERECGRILSLPMYAELEEQEVEQMARALSEFGTP